MSSRPLSSYSIKELPPWAQAAAKEVPQLAEPPLLQGHALSTPAQHRPWTPLSVPSSWRLPPWETQTLYKMLLFRSLDENPLPIFGALLSKAKKNVLELLFPPVSALVLLLSEGVGKDALWELLEWRLQGCEIHQEHHNNTLCRIHLEQGRERIGSRKTELSTRNTLQDVPKAWDIFLQAAALPGMCWLWNRAWMYSAFVAQNDAFISLHRQMGVGVTFQILPVWRGMSGVQK